jgi:hypothetical protein
MEIQIEMKNLYGENKYYPICEKSKIFADLLKQKTLTKNDLEKIKSLGIQINLIQPKIEL